MVLSWTAILVSYAYFRAEKFYQDAHLKVTLRENVALMQHQVLALHVYWNSGFTVLLHSCLFCVFIANNLEINVQGPAYLLGIPPEDDRSFMLVLS